MKYGLILPNGRNAMSMSKEDIYFHLHGYNSINAKRRLQLAEESKQKLNKILDNWKPSGYNHQSGQPIVLKLRAG